MSCTNCSPLWVERSLRRGSGRTSWFAFQRMRRPSLASPVRYPHGLLASGPKTSWFCCSAVRSFSASLTESSAIGWTGTVETTRFPPPRVASEPPSESESVWSSGSDSSRSASASSCPSCRFGFNGEVEIRLDLLVAVGLEARGLLVFEEPFDVLFAFLLVLVVFVLVDGILS